MARKATLIFDKLSFSAEFVKVDRKKLYGWSKIVVNDKDKNPCSSASIADGSHILPSKSTTLQGFNEKGEYIIHFGGDKKTDNYLDTFEGWNFLLRMYQPTEKYFDGSWKVPELVQL